MYFFRTFKNDIFHKLHIINAFKLTKLFYATRYLKINGTMFCIVPNNVLALCYQRTKTKNN